jgi:hypothetical protein
MCWNCHQTCASLASETFRPVDPKAPATLADRASESCIVQSLIDYLCQRLLCNGPQITLRSKNTNLQRHEASCTEADTEGLTSSTFSGFPYPPRIAPIQVAVSPR